MHWAMQCNGTGQMHSIAIIIIMAQLCGGITTPPVQSENEQQMHLLKPQVLTPPPIDEPKTRCFRDIFQLSATA